MNKSTNLKKRNKNNSSTLIRRYFAVTFVVFFAICLFSVNILIVNNYIISNGTFLTPKKEINNTTENKCLFIAGNSKNIQNNVIDSYNKLSNQNTEKANEKTENKNLIIPPIYFKNVPYIGKNVNISQEYKEVYIKILLPYIVQLEQKTNRQRAEMVAIYNNSYYDTMEKKDILKLKELSKEYGVKINEESLWEYIKAINELMIRIDTAPRSLFLSLLIGMSDWGKASMVKDNALYHQLKNEYALKKLPNILRDNDFQHKPEEEIEQSINNLLLYINTSDDFSSFRQTRYRLKHNGKHGDTLELLKKVPSYILQYENNIFKDIFIKQNLTQYENVTVAEGKSICVKIY